MSTKWADAGAQGALGFIDVFVGDGVGVTRVAVGEEDRVRGLFDVFEAWGG